MRTAALSAALCAAACGATLSHVATATSPSPSAVLFDCVTRETERMGFDRTTFDKREMRIIVSRTDPEVRRAETTFRRGFDQLTVDVEGGDRDTGSSIEVTTRSLLEYFDRTGVRLVEREATPGALRAAETLLEACAGGEGDAAGEAADPGS